MTRGSSFRCLSSWDDGNDFLCTGIRFFPLILSLSKDDLQPYDTNLLKLNKHVTELFLI
jgi:hypothetical protein